MADLGNTAVISPTDASNGSGTMPSWLGSAAPSTIDDAGRAIQGAIAREWENRSFAITSTGSANAYVVAYTVAPAALRSGQVYSFITNFAVTGSATVNINALGAKTIKKDVAGVLTTLASGDMASGQFVMLAYNGTDMIWVNWQGPSTAVPSLASTTEVLTGTDAAKTTTPDSIAALWEKGSNIASAGTISIGEGGYHHVTGTTTITDIDFATAKDGRPAVLVFDGILILTHNATTLPLPGSANITTTAGDILMVWQDATDNVKTTFHKISGAAVVGGTLPHIFVKTSGTSHTTNAATTYATVEVVGAGHNGGAGAVGSGDGGGGGGGGGGYAKKNYVLAGNTAYTIAVGTAAGASSTFTDGVTLITGSGGAVGAAGGTSNGGAGGAGGTGTNGDVNLSGGTGSGGGFGDTTTGSSAGGIGGMSGGGIGAGGSGARGDDVTDTAGGAGKLYGGGGGGGTASGAGGGGAGGAFAAGAVIITEYY